MNWSEREERTQNTQIAFNFTSRMFVVCCGMLEFCLFFPSFPVRLLNKVHYHAIDSTVLVSFQSNFLALKVSSSSTFSSCFKFFVCCMKFSLSHTLLCVAVEKSTFHSPTPQRWLSGKFIRNYFSTHSEKRKGELEGNSSRVQRAFNGCLVRLPVL